VWGRSHRLTLAVYSATTVFPREELYGLASQVRKSCAAVPDLSYLNPRDHERLTEEVTEIKRMLTSFIKNLRAFGKQT
jgi:hypothetical protein